MDAMMAFFFPKSDLMMPFLEETPPLFRSDGHSISAPTPPTHLSAPFVPGGRPTPRSTERRNLLSLKV